MDKRFEHMIRRFDEVDSRHAGFEMQFQLINARLDDQRIAIDQNTDRIDILSSRLDQTNQDINLLRRDMINRFNGVGSLLINIDRNVANHETRIVNLETQQPKPGGKRRTGT